MKTPTLEEVKAYFKDAKEVDDNINICIIDIETIRYDKYVEDVIVCNSDCELSGLTTLYNSNGYAKIISYKSNIDLSKLTPDLITELCKDDNVKEILINNGVVKNELEIGKWYKHYVDYYNTDVLFCFNGKYEIKGDKSYPCGVGFNTDGKYIDDERGWTDLRNIILATPQEVGTALINHWKSKNKPFKHYCFDFKQNRLIGWNSDTDERLELFNNGKWLDCSLKQETYIKIPLSEIKSTKSDEELLALVRSIASNY